MKEIKNIEVLTRLLQAAGFPNEAALAAFLGISAQAIYQAKKKGQIPAIWAVNVAEVHNVSLDWLLLGRGSMYPAAQPEPPVKTELPVAEKASMSGACLRCRQLDEKLDKANEKADTANERLYEAMRENSSLKEQIGILSTNLAAFKKCYGGGNGDDGETGSGESEGGEIRSGEEEPLSFLARAS